MEKINKPTTFIKKLSILFIWSFILAIQSVLCINSELKEVTQHNNKIASLNQYNNQLTQQVLQLDLDIQKIQRLHLFVLQLPHQKLLPLLNTNLLQPQLLNISNPQQLSQNTLILTYASNIRLDKLDCMIDLMDLNNDILKILSLNRELQYIQPLNKRIQHVLQQIQKLNIKQKIQMLNNALLKLDQENFSLKQMPISLSVIDINKRIQKLNGMLLNIQLQIHQINNNLLQIQNSILPLNQQEIQQINDFFDRKIQPLMQQIHQLNQQQAALNREIVYATKKKPFNINQQIDNCNQQIDIQDHLQNTQLVASIKKKQKVLNESITSHDTITTIAINTATSAAVDIITSSLSCIIAKQSSKMISSGSNIYSNNVWNIQSEFFIASINPKKHKKIQKHKIAINGICIAANKYLNDKTIIGVTGLYSNLNIQDSKKILNNTDYSAYSISLYDRYYLKQNVFTQGIIGFTKYGGKTQYLPDKHFNKISGKGYYCDLMLEYNLYLVNHYQKLILSPIVGIRYNALENFSHELFDGTTVGSIKHYILDGRLGSTIECRINNIDTNMLIIPKIHAFIHMNLYTASSNIMLKYSNSRDYCNVNFTPVEMHKLFYQLGMAVTILHDQIGLGMSYNSYLAKEYNFYIGSINIQVNF